MKKNAIKIKSNPNQYQSAISCLNHPVLWRAGIEEVAKEHGFCVATHPDLQFETSFAWFWQQDEYSEPSFSLAHVDREKLYFVVIDDLQENLVFAFRVSSKQRSDGAIDCTIEIHYLAKLWDSEEPIFHSLVDQRLGQQKISVSCFGGGDIGTIIYEGLSFASPRRQDFGTSFAIVNNFIRSHAKEIRDYEVKEELVE